MSSASDHAGGLNPSRNGSWEEWRGDGDPEQRFRRGKCPSCGHRFLPLYQRCRRCNTPDPEWSIFNDPRIDRSGDCWLWTGVVGKNGYGYFNDQLVHRIAWEEENGDSAEGWEVIHSCDVPRCLNPSHLRRAAHIENMQDARDKGRLNTSNLWRRGEWTHCMRSHEFTPENTYIDPSGKRECRACKRARWQEWAGRNRGRS